MVRVLETIRYDQGNVDLAWGEVEVGTPGPNEVLIEVHATAMNWADIRTAQSPTRIDNTERLLPGLECSGTVIETGSGITDLAPGDTVCALIRGGGYTPIIQLDRREVIPVPAHVGLDEAACFPEAAATAWFNVYMDRNLSPQDWILIHAGASSVGAWALQIGRYLGLRTISTVVTEAERQSAVAHGADVVIDSVTENVLDRIRDVTNGRGVRRILDCIGGPYLASNLQVAAPDAMISLIGVLGGGEAEIDLGDVLGKRITLKGTSLGKLTDGVRRNILSDLEMYLLPAFEEGLLQSQIHSTIPLDDVESAVREMFNRDRVGKIVVRVK